MEISRMSNSDMIQYCNEALAWEELGPVDIHFFESVKRIVTGECKVDEPEDISMRKAFSPNRRKPKIITIPAGRTSSTSEAPLPDVPERRRTAGTAPGYY